MENQLLPLELVILIIGLSTIPALGIFRIVRNLVEWLYQFWYKKNEDLINHERRKSKIGLFAELKMGSQSKRIRGRIASQILALDDDALEEVLQLWQETGETDGLDVHKDSPFKIMRVIKEIMECPVCTEIALPPIPMCAYGHIICRDCRKKLILCALCRTPLGNSRCYPIEGIVSLLNLPCRNNGCERVVKGSELEEHINTCQIRPIPCYETKLSQCNGALIDFEDFMYHLRQFHKCVEFETSLDVYAVVHYLYGFVDQKLDTVPCRHGDKTYFFNVEMQDSYLCIWATMLGSEDEARKSTVSISLQGTADPKLHIDWNVPVHSVHKRLSEIQQLAHCAIIPRRYLVNFCDAKIHPEDCDCSMQCDMDENGISYYGLEIIFQIMGNHLN